MMRIAAPAVTPMQRCVQNRIRRVMVDDGHGAS
jgi:hypothetical protein